MSTPEWAAIPPRVEFHAVPNSRMVCVTKEREDGDAPFIEVVSIKRANGWSEPTVICEERLTRAEWQVVRAMIDLGFDEFEKHFGGRT